ncbi:Mitochondrial inner membrane protein oxa1 [Rhizophlyctis rosea]|nr:Mitochondrial inner membrane protein oxa1 [Rhizophlyctis rosea]
MADHNNWPPDLFSETGKLNLNALGISVAPSPSPSNHDSHTTTASSQHATPVQPETSILDLLSVPPAIILELAKNRSEAELLLEIGHCGFKLQQLMTWDQERAVHQKLLENTIRSLTFVSVQSPDYLIPQVMAKEYRAALPILETALAKVSRQRTYLRAQLEATISDLAHLRGVCAQYAEINTQISQELRRADVGHQMAENKIVLAELQRTLISRINCFVLGLGPTENVSKASWEKLVDHASPSKSVGETPAADRTRLDISDITHVTETFDTIGRPPLKRKRGQSSHAEHDNSNGSLSMEDSDLFRNQPAPKRMASHIFEHVDKSPHQDRHAESYESDQPLGASETPPHHRSLHSKRPNLSSGSNGHPASVDSPPILRTKPDRRASNAAEDEPQPSIITSTPIEGAASPAQLHQLGPVLQLSGIAAVGGPHHNQLGEELEGVRGHDSSGSSREQIGEVEIEMPTIGPSQFTNSQVDAEQEQMASQSEMREEGVMEEDEFLTEDESEDLDRGSTSQSAHDVEGSDGEDGQARLTETYGVDVQNGSEELLPADQSGDFTATRRLALGHEESDRRDRQPSPVDRSEEIENSAEKENLSQDDTTPVSVAKSGSGEGEEDNSGRSARQSVLQEYSNLVEVSERGEQGLSQRGGEDPSANRRKWVGHWVEMKLTLSVSGRVRMLQAVHVATSGIAIGVQNQWHVPKPSAHVRILPAAAQRRSYFWSSKPAATEQQSVAAVESSTIIQEVTPPSIPVNTPATPAPPTNNPSEPLLSSPATEAPADLSTFQEVVPKLTEITKIGDIQNLGLGGWSPVGIAEQLLEAVYVTTGLPWWATIACTTVLIRITLFPIVIKMQRSLRKMAEIMPQMKPIQEEIQAARAAKDPVAAREATIKMMDLYKANNVTPFTGFLPFVQAPFFISFFWGLKSMADKGVPGFERGGFGWVTDLTVPDPYYILPAVAGVGMLTVFEIGAETGGVKPPGSEFMKYFLRAMAVLGIPLTGYLPPAVFCYWITSNIFSIFQVLLLKQKSVRKFFNLPDPKAATATPTPTANISFADATSATANPASANQKSYSYVQKNTETWAKKAQAETAAAERIRQGRKV